MAQQIDDRLLTADDLAHLLRLSRAHVYRLTSENPDALPPRIALPASRMLRWRASDVEAWLRDRTVVPAQGRGRPTKSQQAARVR